LVRRGRSRRRGDEFAVEQCLVADVDAAKCRDGIADVAPAAGADLRAVAVESDDDAPAVQLGFDGVVLEAVVGHAGYGEHGRDGRDHDGEDAAVGHGSTNLGDWHGGRVYPWVRGGFTVDVVEVGARA
jgi:hypothetical protein